MPAYTANYQLPYPSGMDAPCDFDQQWCDFTNAMQQVIDRFQATVDRTTPVIPMAAMRIPIGDVVTLPGVMPTPVRYTAVEVDTADWIDFDADNSVITVRNAGRFAELANIQFQTVNGDNSQRSIWFSFNPNSPIMLLMKDYRYDTGVGASTGAMMAQFSTNTAVTNRYVIAETEFSSQTQQLIESAVYAVYWIADQERP